MVNSFTILPGKQNFPSAKHLGIKVLMRISNDYKTHTHNFNHVSLKLKRLTFNFILQRSNALNEIYLNIKVLNEQ